MIPHTLSSTTLTVLGPDFMPKTIPHTHPAWDEIVEALRTDDTSKLHMLIDLPAAVVEYMQGAVTIYDRVLYFNSRPLDTGLTRRILEFMGTGQPELAQPLIAFLEKVMQNPSARAVQGLYEWCERSNLPIATDGDILAWKIVRGDFTDLRTGTFDNSIGKTVQVERWEVDEDPDRTCSHGLHFCSTGYLPSYGGFYGGGHADRHIMVVKINPADVVAFPRDYGTSKGRTWRYEVIGEVPEEKAKDFFPAPVSDYGAGGDDEQHRPLDLEVEAGRHYRTRGGLIADITVYDPDASFFKYSGDIVGDNSAIRTWTEFGSYTDEYDHHFDLFELLPEDFDPDVSPAAPASETKPTGWLARLFGAK